MSAGRMFRSILVGGAFLTLVGSQLWAQESADQPAAEPDRIFFRIPFSAEKGGGSAEGTAEQLDYLREDYVVATGGVELVYKNYKFQAERIAVDLQAKT
ncbi:MAG: hypothetical protein V3S30_00410, partial [Thermoanaerobaculia bacterium]